MKRRGRVRRVSKWACTGLAVVVVGGTVASRWRQLTWSSPKWPMPYTAVWLSRGCLVAMQWPHKAQSASGVSTPDVPGWEWGWTNPPGRSPRVTDWHYGFSYAGSPSSFIFRMSLVYPVLLATLAASLLWRWDFVARRRERVGLCPKCGYDRRGIAADAPCPECGKKEPAPAADPPRS